MLELTEVAVKRLNKESPSTFYRLRYRDGIISAGFDKVINPGDIVVHPTVGDVQIVMDEETSKHLTNYTLGVDAGTLVLINVPGINHVPNSL